MRTERWISALGQKRMNLLVNSSNLSRTLPFCRGIISFWTSNQQQLNAAYAQQNRETERYQRQLMRNQRKSTRAAQLCNKGSTLPGIILFHQDLIFLCLQFMFDCDPWMIIPSSGCQKIWRRDIFRSRQRTSFFASVPKLTVVKVGVFGSFFLSSELESPGKNKATCFESVLLSGFR